MRHVFTKTLLLALLLALAVAAAASAEVTIDETNFPDATFRAYVSENFDADKDGKLSDEECAAVTNIDVSEKGIASLKGIENFPGLEVLIAYSNKLTELDVSKNPNLVSLFCWTNQLTSLDISNNSKMKDFSCAENALTSLKTGSAPKLDTFDCSVNKLDTVDVTGYPALTFLDVSYNQLKGVDLSKNTKLERLWCEGDQLTTLDVKHMKNLEQLWCGGNQLAALDLSGNKAMKEIICGGNRIEALDVSACAKLEKLDASGNALTSLDVSKCAKLAECVFGDCAYEVHPNLQNKVNLSKLPGKFDAARASDWRGGSVEGTTLTVDEGAETVVYRYDGSDAFWEDMTLVIGEQRDEPADPAPAQSIKIHTPNDEVNFPASGEAITLTAEVLPEGASQEVTWTVKPAKAAAIDASGNLTFLKPGKVTVTAQQGKKKAKVKLTAYDPLTTLSVTLENAPAQLRVGAEETLVATIFPATSKDPVTWTVKGKGLEIVPSDDGLTCLVKGVAKGKATVTCASGKKKAKVKITVAE